MLSERLQILLTPEQKARLDAAAKARGASVGGLVRAAIDAHLGGPDADDREQALARIRARRAELVEPARLAALLDERGDERWSRLAADERGT